MIILSRSILLLALALALPACDPPPQDGTAVGLLSGNTCRDTKGRFAKCQTCPDGSKVWTGAHCPNPALAPVPMTPPEPVVSLSGLAPIASNFDTAPSLVSAWGSGAVPKSAAPDVVGAFRFICNAGQILRDDPIVYPNQPGKSHLHQFYGNTAANAASTYASLRAAGNSTCGDPLNRSAYWMPAMLDGNGNVVRPDEVSIYYKRRPRSDPKCQGKPGVNGSEGQCIALPNGLKFIFGYDMLTGKSPTGSLWFNCNNIKYNDHPAAHVNCPAGTRIGAVIQAPDCWDGKNLDSANHRDHVSYQYYDPNTGQKRCPDTHPYVIAAFTLGAWYTVPPNAKLSLSSDAMVPTAKPGTTFHADFFMAWDPPTHEAWEAGCLDQLLNCSGGDLGNGKQIRNAWARVDPSPKVTPISP